jgi:hypothetical protein
LKLHSYPQLPVPLNSEGNLVFRTYTNEFFII